MNEEEILKLEEIYKMFASAVRLKVLLKLENGECCVNELAEFCSLSQPAISHQLKDLKQHRIIKSQKKGMNVFYSLMDTHILEMLKIGLAHIREKIVMNKNEKNSAKKYNKLASNYDSSFDGKFTAKFKNKMLEFCNVSSGDKVLDVGCGNGSLLYAISQKEDINAFGIDISPNMVSECQKKYKDITFEVSSGEKLNFDNDTLDMVTICCVLHHLNNAENFVEEANRTLKSGGHLIIGEPWFPWGLRQLTDWIVSPLLKAGDNKIFSHKRLKKLILNANFEIVDIYKKGVIQIIKARKI